MTKNTGATCDLLAENGNTFAGVELISHSGGNTFTVTKVTENGPVYEPRRKPVVLSLLCPFPAEVQNGNYRIRSGQSAPVRVRVVVVGFKPAGAMLQATILECP